jgi:hypothetical protein
MFCNLLSLTLYVIILEFTMMAPSPLPAFAGLPFGRSHFDAWQIYLPFFKAVGFKPIWGGAHREPPGLIVCLPPPV